MDVDVEDLGPLPKRRQKRVNGHNFGSRKACGDVHLRGVLFLRQGSVPPQRCEAAIPVLRVSPVQEACEEMLWRRCRCQVPRTRPRIDDLFTRMAQEQQSFFIHPYTQDEYNAETEIGRAHV